MIERATELRHTGLLFSQLELRLYTSVGRPADRVFRFNSLNDLTHLIFCPLYSFLIVPATLEK